MELPEGIEVDEDAPALVLLALRPSPIARVEFATSGCAILGCSAQVEFAASGQVSSVQML